MGKDFSFDDLEYTIVKIDESTVKITLPEFGPEISVGPSTVTMLIPSSTFGGIRVSESNGKCTLSSGEQSVNANINGTQGKLTLKELAGTAQGNKLSLNYEMAIPGMPHTMVCSFSGTK